MAIEVDASSVEVNSVEKRTRQVIQSTIIVVVAFTVARIISLGQTFIIGRTFGVGMEWDAYVSANRIPEQIFNLIAGGALANAFIPVFSSFLAQNDREGAWRIASKVINTIFTLTLVLSILAAINAPWLVRTFIASGFSIEQQALTVRLMRILLVGTVIFSVSGILMGILQSHNRFLLPALAPIMYDVGILFGAVVLLKPFGIYGIVYGAVIGAALHLAIQLPGLLQVKARWWPQLGWNDPTLWRVARLMLPNIAAIGLFGLNFTVMGNIASWLGTGAVSGLDWGWRLMQIPETLIGTAMATVIFPTLSALSAVNDEKGKRDAMSGALRFIFIGTIPSVIGLILVGRLLIRLLEGGAFDSSASALVYAALQAYALGIIAHAVLEVAAPSFYADKDTITPLLVRLGGSALNIGLAYVLSGVGQVETYALLNRFSISLGYPAMVANPINVAGLALANTIGVTFEIGVLLWLLRRRWHGINESALTATVVKTVIASLAMGLAIVGTNFLWDIIGLNNGRLLFTIAQILVETGIGIIVFFGTAMLLKMDELKLMLTMYLRRRKAVQI